ncbi:D123-domain-containing protein [Pisolithus thermaeus]|nr:D123-domain-containing protein [Pisolithus thermaeus]
MAVVGHNPNSHEVMRVLSETRCNTTDGILPICLSIARLRWTPNDSHILAFQFTNWHPSFTRMSPKSTAITPLGKDPKHLLEPDSIFVPEGSEAVSAKSTLSDDSDDEREDIATAGDRIRFVIREYKAVFPKLNFSSPKDAATGPFSPLKCTTPEDIYLLLKSSDFITHDFSIESVFDGCETDALHVYELELVLRKRYPVDCSREVRCFVRNDTLVRMTQRDTDFYDFMIDLEIQKTIRAERVVRPNWDFPQKHCGHVIDFNPSAPHTDPLLFTYEELHECLYQRSRVSVEALTLSEGRNMVEFGEIWREEVTRVLREDDTWL